MWFNDFNKKYKLKNKITSIIKFQQVFSFLSLNDIGNFLRDGPFSTDIGIVNLHPSKGTHWDCFINENFIDSFGVVCPRKLSKFIKKRNGLCLFSEYQKQKRLVFVLLIVYIYFT